MCVSVCETVQVYLCAGLCMHVLEGEVAASETF